MRVFITDGDSRAALAVTRSLGRVGHQVIVGERRQPSLAGRSRFCHEAVTYPDPHTNSAAFVDAVSALIGAKQVEVLLPIADVATHLVNTHRDRFGASILPIPEAAVVERAADKVDLVDTAIRLNVPVPRSTVVHSATSTAIDGLPFPIVIKPHRSRLRTQQRWASTAVSYARDMASLRRDLAARPAYEFPVLLQEQIQGQGLGVFLCYHEGRVVAEFGHRRLRERPPWGGVSVLCESVAMHPVARESAVRLLDDLGWHGVAMVEFKHDDRDGIPKLIEVNGRFWGSLQLAIDAGVDFPAILLALIGGSAPPSPPTYRLGVKSRWLWGDVDSLLFSLLHRAKAPAGFKISRWNALQSFFALPTPDVLWENPRWSDLRPFLHETRERLFLPRWPSANEKPAPPRPATRSRPPTSAALFVTSAASLLGAEVDASAWNDLTARSETNTVFQTGEWLGSWCEAFAGERLFVTVRRQEDAGLVGIGAFAVERGHVGRRTIRFLTDTRADYCDLVAGDEKPLVVEAVFKALVDHADWDSIELNNIPAHSSTVDLLADLCKKHKFRYLVSEQSKCPTLLIPGHAHAQSLLNRASLRRRRHYFSQRGQLTFKHLTQYSDIEPYLQPFFEQHIRRWEATGTTSLFRDARIQEFYRRFAAKVDGKNWLLFSVVEFNGEPIALHYGFDYDGRVMWYKPSFDLRHAQHSPGLVLLHELVSYAVAAGRQELDFTIGDEPFKQRFTNHTRVSRRIEIFRSHLDYSFELSRQTLRSAAKRLPLS